MNQEYYGTSAASSDFIAHYGIKGMKWGVRKALAEGNYKALNKHYKKAMRKLERLEKYGTNSKKYAKRAAAYGVAAAGTGTLAVGGPDMGARILKEAAPFVEKSSKAVGKAMQTVGTAAYRTGIRPIQRKAHAFRMAGKSLENIALSKKTLDVASKISDPHWQKGKIVLPSETYKKQLPSGNIMEAHRLKTVPVNNATLYRIGAGALSAGFGAAAARNAYKAANGKRYRQKAIAWRNAINETFGDVSKSALTNKKRKRRS